MPIVAVDGSTGTGKSSVSRAVARALGVACLDTGAMYRAVGYAARQKGIDLQDEQAIATLVDTLQIEVFDSAGGDGDARVLLNGEDVSSAIRTPDAGQAASTIAVHKGVRERLVKQQQAWVQAHPDGAVAEGRDIGSVVLPNADLKVFLTAAGGERARRRAAELGHKDLMGTVADIAQRDQRDTTRVIDPLQAAGDAISIDTTDLTLDQVVDQIMSHLSRS